MSQQDTDVASWGSEAAWLYNHSSDPASTGGDSLEPHDGESFSTSDKDNDGSWLVHCARKFKSGFWFEDCAKGNLNGPYYTVNYDDPGSDDGVEWHYWKNSDYSMKFASLKIRFKK